MTGSYSFPDSYTMVTEDAQGRPLEGVANETWPCWRFLALMYLRRVRANGSVFDPTPETVANIAAVASWLTGGGRPWLLMSGNCGCGKTTMLFALQRYFAEVLRYGFVRDALGITSLMPGLRVVNAKDIIEALDKRDGGDAFGRLCSEPLLGLDDVGVEGAEQQRYGNVVTPLSDLLESRYERRLLTVMTTNLSAEMVGRRYGERTADRLSEMAKVVYFRNGSFR
ncbi:MAG: hypothetical protein LUC33_05025, partial [Prevotellaceae bacterium]|nr:hypothetical protein [Prevotellaceae bacterium]